MGSGGADGNGDTNSTNANNTTNTDTTGTTASGTTSGATDIDRSALITPSKFEHRKLISESLQLTENPRSNRILSYKQQRPIQSGAHEIHSNPLKVLYTAAASKAPMTAKGGIRYIPSAPDRILDAPDIINDYCK